jgi:hypothetical protein
MARRGRALPHRLAAVIMSERFATGLRRGPPDDFSPAVWTREPSAREGRRRARRRSRLRRSGVGATADERAGFRFSMGPWIRLTRSSAATQRAHAPHVGRRGRRRPEAALAYRHALVIDNLQLITRFTGKAKLTGRRACPHGRPAASSR